MSHKGTEILKRLLKKVKRMTPEEYNKFFEECQKDIEDMKKRGIPEMKIII